MGYYSDVTLVVRHRTTGGLSRYITEFAMTHPAEWAHIRASDAEWDDTMLFFTDFNTRWYAEIAEVRAWKTLIDYFEYKCEDDSDLAFIFYQLGEDTDHIEETYCNDGHELAYIERSVRLEHEAPVGRPS